MCLNIYSSSSCSTMARRYQVSKRMCLKLFIFLHLTIPRSVLNILFVRALSSHLQSSASSKSPKGLVPTVCSVNPGLCSTSLARDLTFPRSLFIDIYKLLYGRSAEMGSRTLVHATLTDLGIKGSMRVDGRYLSSCRVEEESDFVLSEEGRECEMKLWVCALLIKWILHSSLILAG